MFDDQITKLYTTLQSYMQSYKVKNSFYTYYQGFYKRDCFALLELPPHVQSFARSALVVVTPKRQG